MTGFQFGELVVLYSLLIYSCDFIKALLPSWPYGRCFTLKSILHLCLLAFGIITQEGEKVQRLTIFYDFPKTSALHKPPAFPLSPYSEAGTETSAQHWGCPWPHPWCWHSHASDVDVTTHPDVTMPPVITAGPWKQLLVAAASEAGAGDRWGRRSPQPGLGSGCLRHPLLRLGWASHWASFWGGSDASGRSLLAWLHCP